MGLFDWLFGRTALFDRLPDRIWMAEDGMRRGLVKEVSAKQRTDDPIVIAAYGEEDGTAVLDLLANEGISAEPWSPPRSPWDALREIQRSKRNVLVVRADEVPDWESNRYQQDEAGAIDVLIWHHHLSREGEAPLERFAAGIPCRVRVRYLSSLDHPLLSKFAGDQVKALLKTLGIESDEVIEHALLNKQISKAQAKLAQTARD